MKYYDIKSNKVINIKENNALKFLYNTFIGRIFLKIATSHTIANIYRLYQNSILSVYKINKFIKKNNIDMTEYEDTKYKSFNSFFMRKIKTDKRPMDKGFISPCDSKVSVFNIDENLVLNIKNSKYTIDELIKEDGSKYKNGTAIVFRLCVDDYHHYIFPFDGDIISKKSIKGVLHTVQPIALKKEKVFSENAREVTKVKSPDYGEVSIIEVGALMIGKIVNEDITSFKKGDEKGHFEFGGSTIIYLFEKNKVNINRLFYDNTNNDIETIVKMGNSLE